MEVKTSADVLNLAQDSSGELTQRRVSWDELGTLRMNKVLRSARKGDLPIYNC